MAPPRKKKPTATQVVKEIKRRTKRVFSAEEKIKIVLQPSAASMTFTRTLTSNGAKTSWKQANAA